MGKTIRTHEVEVKGGSRWGHTVIARQAVGDDDIYLTVHCGFVQLNGASYAQLLEIEETIQEALRELRAAVDPDE